MNEKLNKGKGMAVLEEVSLPAIEDLVKLPPDFGTVDIKVKKNVMAAMIKANGLRNDAFLMLEYAKLEEPRLENLFKEIKIARAKAASLQNEVGKAMTYLWQEFGASSSENAALVTMSQYDPAIKKKIDDYLNPILDKSELVAQRDAAKRHADELQAEINSIEDMKPQAFQNFAEAEELVRSVGINPADLGWGPKAK